MAHEEGVDVFWDAQASHYNAPERTERRQSLERHRFAADVLSRQLSGRVLCAGGLWVGARPDGLRACSMTVLDVSASMLAHFESMNVEGVQGDAREMPFSSSSFDHVVFPLVVHHITDGSARRARENVGRVLSEARRVLKPGGSVWLREIVVPTAVYWMELAAAPVTRWVLGLRKIPLVILHDEAFLRSSLWRAGFTELQTSKVSDPRRWTHTTTPIVGLPQLRVPEATLPPIRHVLIRGRA